MSHTAPERLTAADFSARVHALAARVAVFDCDGTLWSGDAGSSFMRWTFGEAVNGVQPATPLLSAEKIAWLRERYDGYLAGSVSEVAICGEMVQVYEGLSVAALRTAAAEFFRACIEPNIFPELRSLIAELQAEEVDIWAVSSTCDWVIEEGVRRFHIPPSRVLAARVEAEGGLATNRLIDVPTDEGKVTALAGVSITGPDAVFGNSIHDAAMLAIARGRGKMNGAFPVNPSPELVTESATRGWAVFYPAAITPPEL